MRTVDINVDLAEGFSDDLALLQIATSANVCCGAHAGSVALTLGTVAHCRSMGVRVGAHIGARDRSGMGRSPIPLETGVERDAFFNDLVRQVGVTQWAYIKPHGWLYNASIKGGAAAEIVSRVVGATGLPLMGLSCTYHREIAAHVGVRLISEGFADRRYLSDGTLVPRSEPGAVLDDESEIARQVLGLAETCESICIHSDTPGCVQIAESVRSTLVSAGYQIGWR